MKAKLDTRKPTTAPDRKALLDSIRRAVKACKGKNLTYTKFLSISKLRPQDIFRHFSRWNDALRAAGFEFERFNAPVTSARLLEDWGRSARRHGRIPTHLEYNLHSKHSATTFVKRFGAWSKVPEAFRAFAEKSANNNKSAEGTSQWSDVISLLTHQGKPSPRRKPHPPGTRSRHGHRRHARLAGRPICGDPLDFAGLRHAPANEAGVVFLFGAMARDLGFLIDSFQIVFPDCEAKRLIAPNTWQPVSIEFEFESRNFLVHGHDPAKCDLIICWEHNWPDCPPNLEVISLKEELERRKT